MSTDKASYQVLGLAGQQGAGKDWTYESLKALYNGRRQVRRMAFADGVRREAAEEVLHALSIPIGVEPLDITAYGDEDKHYIYGVNQDLGAWTKPYTEAQRALLQWWGTNFRREQDPDYWVNYGMTFIDEHAQDGDLWVITDVRFDNEAESIREHGGKVALVWADSETRANRLGISLSDLYKRSQHPSEKIDFHPDFVIANTTDLVLDPELLDWLGLDGNCFKCVFAQPHTWHDNGEANFA